MSKWYGKVGYVINVETEPGIWEPQAKELPYFGDVLKNNSRWATSANLNDTPTIDSQISIVADPFARQHFSSIKYVEFMDSVREATMVTPQYPRLVISMGGIWNGEREQAESANEAGGASGD